MVLFPGYYILFSTTPFASGSVRHGYLEDVVDRFYVVTVGSRTIQTLAEMHVRACGHPI